MLSAKCQPFSSGLSPVAEFFHIGNRPQWPVTTTLPYPLVAAWAYTDVLEHECPLPSEPSSPDVSRSPEGQQSTAVLGPGLHQRNHTPMKYRSLFRSLRPSGCISKLDRHWFRLWLVTCLELSHYLNQCWLIVNWIYSNIYFREIWMKMQQFSLKNMPLKMSSAVW